MLEQNALIREQKNSKAIALGIGRSRGGLTSKIVAVADALGYSARFVILPSQKHDLVGTPRLMEGLSFGALTADQAFDVDWLLKELEERGAEAVIPPKKNRRQIRDYDRDMYGQRHQIENVFAKNQEFRAIATRNEGMSRLMLNLIWAVLPLPRESARGFFEEKEATP